MENEKVIFDLWCVVELFGHSKIAGRCTEQSVAGKNMLRVDVPETADNPSFTRFFNHDAIYAINPVTEEVAKFVAIQLNGKPIDSWDIRKFQEKLLSHSTSANSSNDDDLPY